jgi:glucokinase
MKIGIDIGGTNLSAGLLDEGSILRKETTPLEDGNSEQGTIGQVVDLIRSLFDPAVEGIGIGVPSVVDVNSGIVYNVVNIPSWKAVPLKTILEAEFGVPVFINNDSNCFAWGEHQFGKLRHFKSAIGITLGTGLGGGVIINNTLYCGPNCGAGELGMLPYRDHNIEYYCSNNFFKVFHNTSGYQAYQLALKGDDRGIDMWKAFGKHLGHALMAAMYAYDPEAIVIGGTISNAQAFFDGAMRETLQDFEFPETVKNLRIYYSDEPDIALFGAAALVSLYLPDHQSIAK